MISLFSRSAQLPDQEAEVREVKEHLKLTPRSRQRQDLDTTLILTPLPGSTALGRTVGLGLDSTVSRDSHSGDAERRRETPGLIKCV
jgi:hypothetical protein